MQAHPPRIALWLILTCLLAVFTYFYGLDSEHIPKNGDEYVYAHITRLTAESGHWLPLQSALHEMRNTKPPLLFWQGMASTGWGGEWTLWRLRWANVLYTLLTATLVAWVAGRVSRQVETGLLAGVIYLGFFSTYRFGRPFLTNAPETFWLTLPFALLLVQGAPAFVSRWRLPLLLGLSIGIGLLYKSFAMLAPVGLALAWWYLDERQYRLATFLRLDACKLALLGIVALGVFALWFALDPDPGAVWREFVVGENAGKLDPHGGSYWQKLLWGASSIWSLGFGFLQNAILLAPPLLVLFIADWRQRRELGQAEKRLWMWVAVFFVVFSIPSQRSARYLLDVMPALAMLLALGWQRLGRWAFAGAHALVLLWLVGLAWVSGRLAQEVGGGFYPLWWWALLAGAALLSLFSLSDYRGGRNTVLPAVLLAYLALAGALAPLDGPAGHFRAETVAQLRGQTVWVPYNFNAKFEIYRFEFPGAAVQGYHEDLGWHADELAARGTPWFVVEQPLDAPPPACAGCTVVDTRLKPRSRQTPEEIRAMLHGAFMQHLFAREYLVHYAL